MGLGSSLCNIEDFVSKPYKPGGFDDSNTILPTTMHWLYDVNN